MEYMSTLQNHIDELKPSLFELLWEQQLSSLLPPSLRYVLAVATHRNPRYLLRVLNSFDELYALLSLIVERYYLRTFGGSFTENFYSLKRERVLATKNGEAPRTQLGAPGPLRDVLKLRASDVWKNLAVMVGLPYLKRKLDESYDIHVAPHASLIVGSGPRYRPDQGLPHNPTVRQRLAYLYKWFLRNAYPSVNAVYHFSILAFQLAYLFNNTKYSSPFLWLIGTRIRRLGPADRSAIAMAMQPKTASSIRGASRASFFRPQILYSRLLSSLRILLPTSILALKFLEWWHTSDFPRQLARKATEALDLPAPVVTGMPPLSPAASQVQHLSPATEPIKSAAVAKQPRPPISATTFLPILTVPIPHLGSGFESQGLCPICVNPLTNPTACQTGYVFCYSCIFRWLNGEHERQVDFMNGEGGGAAWEDGSDEGGRTGSEGGKIGDNEKARSREGKWESGRGRCAVTGRRVLGGTEGLRRVLV